MNDQAPTTCAECGAAARPIYKNLGAHQSAEPVRRVVLGAYCTANRRHNVYER